MVAVPSAIRALLAGSAASALHNGWASNNWNGSGWGSAADCNISTFVPQFPPNQTQLVVPKDLEPHFIGLGFGVQNYTCTSSNTYLNVGAYAELFDLSCYVNATWFSTVQEPAYDVWVDANVSIALVIDFIHFLNPPQNLAQHYFVPNPLNASAGLNPKWDFTSSGKFEGNPNAFMIGKGNGTLPSPNNATTDIAWLEILNLEGEIAQEVFRYDTVGGQPPSSVQGDTAIVQASDGGEVQVQLQREAVLTTAYIEVIGNVVDATTIKMLACINLGDELDMNLVNDVVELWHDPRFAKMDPTECIVCCGTGDFVGNSSASILRTFQPSFLLKMTRFKAYWTDSEEEDEEETNIAHDSDDSTGDDRRVDEEIGSDSDASSEDGAWHPDRRRELSHVTEDTESEEEAALDGSSDDDDDNAPRARPSVQFDPAIKSPPPTKRSAADPTIIPWARELGVDAQKMHVMQTSLFRMPEEEAALKALSRPATRRKPSLFASLNRKHSRDSEGEGLRADSRQRTSFAQDIEPASYRPSRKYARVEGSASAVSGKEDAFVDAGLALGRSFRVSWGPSGTLVHLGALCGPYSSSETTANSSIVQKSTVPLVAAPIGEASERASKLLSHHLGSTPIESDAEGVPFANPSRQLSFSSFAAQFPATDLSFEACLFRLGRALFDPIDLRLADSAGMEVRHRAHALRRKAALSKWLETTIANSVEADLRDNPGGDWAATAFTLLSGNQVEKACEIAMDSGNVKLASLMSQYPGDDEFRADLQTQLSLWREQRIDAHINPNTRKIYALLAGIVHTLEGSKGAAPEQCPDVIITKGLDWKRIFGLHLWFGEPMESTIADAFASYDALWKNLSSGTASPIPWYNEQSVNSNQPGSRSWVLPSSATPPDALYSLIRLHSDPTCTLSTILSPLSFSASPADFSLAWHMYIILSRCLRVRDLADREGHAAIEDDAIDNSNSDEPSVEGHSPSADLLANSYALQLEQAGMIQEAVFVLLHIEGSAGRVKAVKELLTRCAGRLDDWTTRGLVGSLKLPMAWVNEAKATYALDCGDVYGAYELYLTAGLYNAAHDLAVRELAPDAVIRRDLDLLRDLFDKFRPHVVDGWQERGKVFLDYAHILTRLPELHERIHSGTADPADTTELEQLARSVPKIIGILPDLFNDRSDPCHTAAFAEMTNKLAVCLNKVKPLVLYQSRIRAPQMTEGMRLRNVQTAAFERFLKMVEVA
ncbi:uncharacterized protein FIBRA_01227 [Fibroporia radiculosa]|uniref:Nuclear pore complex protein NUP96 C-terminal domain-containing protein n=1 Tax=Fibroporia radiculosa TaxID=599839 RepID=J4HSZ2_9APHY|nr:uncharacterized protein FIBRA_01227 [Fibroporia radiculosa]CCL99212.1 predicted protein [Fibroporia radiculosa]